MPKAPTKTPRKRTPSKKLPVPTCWYTPDPATNPENVGCLLYITDVEGNSMVVIGLWSKELKQWLDASNVALEQDHVVSLYSPVFLPSGNIWKV